MSLWRDELFPSRATMALVAALTIWGILSLSRTFTSDVYLAWAVPALAVGAAFAFAFSRSLGTATMLLVSVEILTLPALFARAQTFYLLPTASSWDTVGRLFRQGIVGVAEEAAPVPPEPRFMVVIWTTALLIGFLAASWIVVARPIGAVVTSLSVVAFAGSVGHGGGQTLFATGAVVLTGAFFLADGRHRIASWSRASSQVRPPSLGLPTLAVATLIAVFAPSVVGSATPLVNLEGNFDPRLVIIKPLSDVQRQLQTDPPIEVMRVDAPRPAYWRLTGLNTYTGDEWILEAHPRPAQNGSVPPPEPATSGETLTQTYHITSLLSPWLPAAYAALDVRVSEGVEVEADESSTTLLLDEETRPDLTYTVTSRLPSLEEDLGGEAGEPSGDRTERLFADLAEPIVQGASTPLEKALALEDHFRSFTYSEDVPGGHSADRLQGFLDARTGYCEQFSATMTLMLRGIGVPARVAVGFLPGTERDGQYVVTTREAHAWVEAKIPGSGWIPFDPTPGRGQPRGDVAQQDAGIPTPGPATDGPTPPPTEATPEPATPPPPNVPPPSGGEGGAPLGPILFALLGVMVVGSVPGAKYARGELRRRRAAAEAVPAAYAELLDRAADLGLRPRTAETEWELYHRLFGGLPEPGPRAAANVIQGTVLSRYAPRELTQEQAAVVWRSVTAARTALAQASPWWRRLTAPFDPRTLLPEGGLRAMLPRPRRPAIATRP